MKSVSVNRGFTIVELLIVIVVIAILAAISIVAYNGIQARATDSANLNNASSITKAIQMYKVDNSGSPPICAGGNGAGCTLSTLKTSLVPTYIPQLTDDTDAAYSYDYVGTPYNSGAWSVRMYKRSTNAYCKFGEYPSSLDTWWSSAPKC